MMLAGPAWTEARSGAVKAEGLLGKRYSTAPSESISIKVWVANDSPWMPLEALRGTQAGITPPKSDKVWKALTRLWQGGSASM